MIEKIKTISNPLTVIAIFAALAEIAGTGMLGVVDVSIQSTFVWFVMLFPILIVLLFFATLNFNPKVLYAPSDFRDEEIFLKTMLGAKLLDSNLEDIETQIEEAKKAIAEEAQRHLGAVEGAANTKLSSLIEQYLQGIRNSIETTRETAENLKLISFEKLPNSAFQARIIHILKNKGGMVSISDIAKTTGMSIAATQRSLEKLRNRNIVTPDESSSSYSLNQQYLEDN